MFISLEGIDGSGKTTQLGLLAKWLSAAGRPVVITEWNSSALVKAYRAIGEFDPNRPLKPWLCRICANCCVDMVRDRKRDADPLEQHPQCLVVRAHEPLELGLLDVPHTPLRPGEHLLCGRDRPECPRPP